MTATAAGTAADGPPARARKKRGSNGYPRGVQETTSGKFQARVNYKPPDQKQGAGAWISAASPRRSNSSSHTCMLLMDGCQMMDDRMSVYNVQDVQTCLAVQDV